MSLFIFPLLLLLSSTIPAQAQSSIAVGSYTGDGQDNRQIVQLGFQPDAVIIKGVTNQVGVIRTSSMSGDNSKPMVGNTALTANLIQSFDTSGFTVGNDARVNSNGVTYHWVAFKAASGEMKVSSYDGDGINNHEITGVGFSPDLLFIMSASTHAAVLRPSTSSNTFDFTNGAGFSGVGSHTSDGFKLYTDTRVNANGVTYHYIAWKSVAGKQKFNGYYGDGSDGLNISGLGFQPYYVILKDVSSAQDTIHHPATLGFSTDATMYFKASANLDTNRIQALQSDGFQVGSDNDSNKNGDFYAYFAWTQSVPTAVRMEAFTAAPVEGRGVLLRWRTGFEVDNLGFHIYREDGSQLTRINPELIKGSALLARGGTVTAGHSYQWWDDFSPSIAPTPTLPRQGGGIIGEGGTGRAFPTLPPGGGGQGWGGLRYWLEDVELSGKKTMHGPVFPVMSQGPLPKRVQSALLGHLSKSQAGEDSVFLKAQPLQARLRKVAKGAFYSEFRTPHCAFPQEVQWALAESPAVKLFIQEEGWYRVTQPELLAAGLNPKIDPRYLRMFVDGVEQPMVVKGEKEGRFGPKGFIEFYGTGLDTPYTDSRVYWLVSGSKPGKRVPHHGAGGFKGQTESASFPFTVEKRPRTIYFTSLKNGEEDNFFGPLVWTTPLDQILKVQHPDPVPPEEAVLEVALQGVTEGAHKVKILLNEVEVGSLTFEGQSPGKVQLPVSHALLGEGDNRVRLIGPGGETDASLLHYIRLTYWHTYTADDDTLRFMAKGGERLWLDGFRSSQIRVVDITDPQKIEEVVGVVKAQGASFVVEFRVPGEGQRTLWAFTSDKVGKPAAVEANQPSSWHRAQAGADLVIISHESFLESLQPLKALREGQGWSVELIDVEDLYDEFSFGIKTPRAIRDFLLRSKSSWQKPPGFILLVGDASFDPRNHMGLGNFDLVPTKFVDTALMETASDDWFVDFSGNGLPEMAMGRLPVHSIEEAQTVVSKIVGYEQSRAGAWANKVLLVSDRNEGYDFEGVSEEVGSLLPGEMEVGEIYRGQGDDEAARSALWRSLHEGQLLVNYLGHGSVEVWGGGLLTSEDAPLLRNAERLPFYILMTCLNGMFEDVYTASLAEALLKAEEGGAVAVWASSGLTLPEGQAKINKELVRLLFNGESLRIGEAVRRAKGATTDPDVRRTWILFGDPATRLKQ